MRSIALGKSKIHGRGIFAARSFKKGESIARIQGKVVRKTARSFREAWGMRAWFGIGNHTWIDPQRNMFRYLNHSCEPNAAVTSSRALVAMESIPKGSEIFIDYSMTDDDPYFRLDCCCKAKNCRKTVANIYAVPQRPFKKHLPYMAEYFKRQYRTRSLNRLP